MARLKIVHIEDKYTSVKQLIELGKQKHYLLYDEIYEVLPDEVIGLPAEVDAIYRRFEELKIFVLDRPERYANREEIEAAPIDFDKKESEEHEVYAVDDGKRTLVAKASATMAVAKAYHRARWIYRHIP